MSASDNLGGALAALPSIPRDTEGPVFPAPWAAHAFALAVALNQRGVFAWREWGETLGAEIARMEDPNESDPETYWRAWLSTLEQMLARKNIAEAPELIDLQDAWRRAAEVTPHGQPIELVRDR